jgi:hypothetical protein
MSKISKLIKALGNVIVRIIRQFKYCKSSCCESECMTKDSTCPHTSPSEA